MKTSLRLMFNNRRVVEWVRPSTDTLLRRAEGLSNIAVRRGAGGPMPEGGREVGRYTELLELNTEHEYTDDDLDNERIMNRAITSIH